MEVLKGIFRGSHNSSTDIDIADTFSGFTSIEELNFSGSSNNVSLDANVFENMTDTGELKINGLSDESSWNIDGFDRYQYSSDGTSYGAWQDITSLSDTTNDDAGHYRLDTDSNGSADITIELAAV